MKSYMKLEIITDKTVILAVIFYSMTFQLQYASSSPSGEHGGCFDELGLASASAPNIPSQLVSLQSTFLRKSSVFHQLALQSRVSLQIHQAGRRSLTLRAAQKGIAQAAQVNV